MNSQHLIVPYGLIALGIIYLAKPDIFFTWIARRMATDEQRVMPRKNLVFMRVLGVTLVIIGTTILMRAVHF